MVLECWVADQLFDALHGIAQVQLNLLPMLFSVSVQFVPPNFDGDVGPFGGLRELVNFFVQ